MPGTDSSYAWQAYIPDSLQMVMHNPERGFVSSANQTPYDTKNIPLLYAGAFFFIQELVHQSQLVIYAKYYNR